MQNEHNPLARLTYIDITKGIAAVLMILGHAQIFFDPQCYYPPRPDLSYSELRNPLQFWIYVLQSSVDAFYFCAGMALGRKVALSSEITFWKDQWPLIKRGMALIVIDLTLISWCYSPIRLPMHFVFGSIACFGVSFLIMALLLKMRVSSILGIASSILIARELLLFPPPFGESTGLLYTLFWGIFWDPWRIENISSLFVVSSWLPIIMLGYCFANLEVRYPRFTLSLTHLSILTLVTTVLFFGMRLFSPFGSLGQEFPSQIDHVFMLSKYPASIQFHLLNMAFCFAYMVIGKYWQSSHYFGLLRNSIVLMGKQIFFVYIFHLLLFGLVRHVFKVSPSMGSLSLSLCIFVITSLISATSAGLYDKLKQKYRHRSFIFRYV